DAVLRPRQPECADARRRHLAAGAGLHRATLSRRNRAVRRRAPAGQGVRSAVRIALDIAAGRVNARSCSKLAILARRRGHAMRVDQAVNIEDLHRMPKRRLPKIAFDFIEGGLEDERGLETNTSAFHKHQLLPRYLVDVDARPDKDNLRPRSEEHTS